MVHMVIIAALLVFLFLGITTIAVLGLVWWFTRGRHGQA